MADCSTSPQTTYLRLDGQNIASNPTLVEQLDRDRKACESGESEKDCMLVKGYVSVSADQAAAKQQQLAAIAAQNATLKNVVVLPPPHKTATAKKQQSSSN
jgi:hypothetical protein